MYVDCYKCKFALFTFGKNKNVDPRTIEGVVGHEQIRVRSLTFQRNLSVFESFLSIITHIALRTRKWPRSSYSYNSSTYIEAVRRQLVL